MIPLIFLIFLLGSCHGLVDSNSRTWKFSLDLMKSTSFNNMAIAPFNLWYLMAAAGLWTYGDSHEQICNILMLPNNKELFLNDFLNLKKNVLDEQSIGVLRNTGMFIYMNNDFHVVADFNETMRTHFGAVIETFNSEDPFETASKANDFIKKRFNLLVTVFRAQDFINTKMIMGNVILFNGYWKSKFDSSHTTVENYGLLSSSHIYEVKTMHKTLKVPYSNMESLKANVMELAMGFDDRFSLLLIMPYRDISVSEVYKNLYEVTLTDILDKLQSDVKKFGMSEVNVTLPRAKIQTSIILNKPLNDVGLNDVFNSEKSEFLGISREDIYIESIDHACEVFFQEEGTFVKSSTPGSYGYPLPTSEFLTEQPFIFFIIEKSTKNVMFGGFYTRVSVLLDN